MPSDEGKPEGAYGRSGALLAAILLLLASIGAAWAGADDWPESKPPARTDARDHPAMERGHERAKERERRRKTPEAKRARERSRTKYRGRSDEARAIARAKFAELFAASLWDGPRLRSGERLGRYLRGDTVSVERPDGRDLVVQPLQPLTFDDGGRRVEVETDLEDVGSALRAESTPARARIAKSARGGVELPRSNIEFRLLGAAGDAELDGDKAFFADALGGEDLDLAVAALPAGAAVLLQLRSQYAPEQAVLDFTLPAGAELRLTRETDDRGTPSDRAAAEVVQDGKLLARIAPPAAWDAGGELVPASYALDGDRLTIRVEHRGGDWEYPLVVDPYIQENYLWHQQPMNAARWGYGETRGEFEPFDCSSSNPYSAWCGMPVSSGPGMYIKAPGWVAYNLYAHAEWYWQAPPNTNIVRVDWNYSHAQGNEDCAYGYIQGPDGNAQGTPSFCTGYSSSNSWQTSCTAHAYASCDTRGSSPGNWAIFGLMMFNGTINDAWAHLKNAYIAIWEGHRPTWSGVSGERTDEWFDPGEGGHTFSAEASDVGLGIKQVRFKRPSRSSASGEVINSAPPSNCDGSRWALCPLWAGYTWGYAYSDLPEGVNTLGLLAEDIVGNPSSGDPGAGTYEARTWRVKIDRSAPTIDLSGDLSARDGQLLTGSSYSMTASATDRWSGVADIRIEVNGVDQGTGPSCTENCTASRPFTFNPAQDGLHTIVVKARDPLNHWAAEKKIQVIVDREKPTASASTSGLKPGDWTDGRSDITTVISGTDAGAGLTRAELALPRETRSKTIATCAGNVADRCPLTGSAPPFTYTAADLNEGVNDLTARTFDAAGRVSEDTNFQVRVDRGTPELDLSGALFEADGQIVSGSGYDLHVFAEDRRFGTATPSGVGTIRVMVDEAEAASFTCESDPCEKDWHMDTATYGDGEHTIQVVATDRAGNETSYELDVTFAHVMAHPPQTLSLGDAGTLRVQGNAAGDEAGTAAADVGDVNGDEVPDLLVGAPHDRPTALEPSATGRVYVVFGGTDLGAGGIQDIDLGALGERGFEIRGPQRPVLAGGQLITRTGNEFGAELAARPVGDLTVFGDVNADGLEDVLIGASAETGGADALPRTGSGQAYVIFGRAGTAPVDMSVTGDPGTEGYRIAGAAIDDRAGESTALLGDVNGDGHADLALTAPGADPVGRSAAGTAYVLYGKADDSDVDLAAGPGQGYAVHGGSDDQLTNVAALGDLNGDEIDDLILGGSDAWIVFGHDSTASIDLAGAFPGMTLDAPETYGIASVGGANDVDGDLTPDAIVGFPDADGARGSSWVVYGQSGNAQLTLDGLPGHQGTRIDGVAALDRSGTAVDGADAAPDGGTGYVVGAPGADDGGSDAGAAYVGSTTAFVGVPPVEEETEGAAALSSISAASVRRDYRGDCWQPGGRIWPFPFVHPKTRRVLRLVACRKALKGTVDRTKGTRTNMDGKVQQMNPNPDPAQGGRRKWPVVDSFGNPFAWVEQGPFPEEEGTDEFDWRVFAADGTTEVDRTLRPAPGSPPNDPGNIPTRLQVQGNGCMLTRLLEDQHALVGLESGKNQPLYGQGFGRQGKNVKVRGFIDRDALPDTWLDGDGNAKDKADIDRFKNPCGKPATYRRLKRDMQQLGRDFTDEHATTNPLFYQGAASVNNCTAGSALTPDGIKDRRCGAPLSNYSAADFAPTVRLLTVSTTSVRGRGGVVKAVVRTGTIDRRDRFGYSDPNVPCGQQRVARWQFIDANPSGAFKPTSASSPQRMFGWVPQNVPAGSPRTGSRDNCP